MKLVLSRIVTLSLSTLLLLYCMACGRQVLSKTNETLEKASATIAQTGVDVAHIVVDAKRINAENEKHCQQQAIHTGDLAESLETEESFYNLRGGFDYDRLPLAWPVHLVRVAKTIDLVRETTIILNDVQEIGKEGDWLFGTIVANSSNAGVNSEAPFFAYSIAHNQASFFTSRDAWISFLAHENIATPSVYSCEDLMKDYMFFGILPFPPWGHSRQTQLVVIFNPVEDSRQ